MFNGATIDKSKSATFMPPDGQLNLLAKCFSSFDFQLFTFDFSDSIHVQRKEIDSAMNKLARSLLDFEGHLATKDPLAELLFRCSNELGTLRMSLIWQNENRMAMEEKPSNEEINDINKILTLYARAQDKFSYRLPKVEFDSSTKHNLLDSIYKNEAVIYEYFGNVGME